MTIKETHDFINFILNKETSGYVSHADIDKALDRAQMSKFVELYGNPKGYQPGRPIPLMAYGQTQKINDDLRYFKKRTQFTSTSTGVIELDNISGVTNGTNREYLHLLGLYVTGTTNNVKENNYGIEVGLISFSESTSNKTFYREVKIVNEDQLAERLISQVTAPSATSPIAILGDGGTKIQMFPELEHSGYFMYLERPKKPLFSFVVDGRKIVHNSSTTNSATFTATNALTLPDGTSVSAGATYQLDSSQDLNWPSDCINDIVNRALTSLGVHIEDMNVYQYTEVKNKEGL